MLYTKTTRMSANLVEQMLGNARQMVRICLCPLVFI